MDMKLRAILRGFIRWQIKEDLFNNIIIDYELAEHYLEETEKSLKDYGVLDGVIVDERICEVTGEKCDCEGMCVEAHT